MDWTQFLVPDGTTRPVQIDLTPELEAMAKAVEGFGYRFECETLDDGYVFFDCCNADEEIANIMVKNGPSVPIAVAELVARSYQEVQRRSLHTKRS